MGVSYYVREVSSRRKHSPDATYVYIAQSTYDPETRRTRVRNLVSLGRKSELDVSTARRLVQQLNRYLDGDALEELDGSLRVAESRLLGPVAFYRGLWEQAGFGELFRQRFAERQFGHALGEVLFALVAQRIIAPASKLACQHWIREIAYLPELADVGVDLLYAAMDELIVGQDEIRQQMYFTATDLLRLDVSVLFYDTTSTYFEVEGPDGEGGLRQYGHSKDERPDRPQALVAVAVNRDGLPVRHWCFPGNTADLTTLETVLDELSALRPRKFVFVGDRGMVSREVLDRLESQGLGYLLGVPRRSGWEEIYDTALGIRGRYRKVAKNLEVKQTEWREGLRVQRLLLCLNREEAVHDQELREAAVSDLEQALATLQQGGGHSRRACALRSNQRFAPWLRDGDDGELQVDREAIRQAARRDGKYVLLTNDLDTDPGELASGYKGLQEAERLFGKLKGVVGLRPNYHQLQERIAAHVLLCIMGTFLVRFAELRTEATAHQIQQTLEPLRTASVRAGQKRAVHRTNLTKKMRVLFEKAGVQPPPKLLEVR